MVTVADPDELRRVAERVLDGPEFREAEPGLVERIVERVGDLIDNVFSLLGGGGAGGVIGWTLLTAAIGGLVWLIVRLVPEARAGRSPSSVRRQGARVEVAEGRDPASWDAEAEEHEAAGRWDEALRARYRALVARLARRGAVRDAPAVTTGEHRAGVARDAAQATVEPEVFASTADRFDEVWYGGAVASADDVGRTRRLADEVDRGR